VDIEIASDEYFTFVQCDDFENGRKFSEELDGNWR